ncbi:MAG: sugar transferase [Bacteroidales bacterium]|nr:sugar transferase [Bacteroidales bacterium]
MKPYRDFFKRVVDVTASGSALLVLAIPLSVVSVWLHFANKGAGIFFSQERPGKGGKIFRIWKFKSMTDERDSSGELLPNEQRITKAGRFIRNTSIDELPQLWNVLKGDMSLIGPRPLPVRYLELYNDHQARRHDVRPGMSGWAQVNGRNNISWGQKFEYDVFYVDNLNFKLDLKILYMTIKKVFAGADIDAGDNKVGGIGFNGHN